MKNRKTKDFSKRISDKKTIWSLLVVLCLLSLSLPILASEFKSVGFSNPVPPTKVLSTIHQFLPISISDRFSGGLKLAMGDESLFANGYSQVCLGHQLNYDQIIRLKLPKKSISGYPVDKKETVIQINPKHLERFSSWGRLNQNFCGEKSYLYSFMEAVVYKVTLAYDQLRWKKEEMRLGKKCVRLSKRSSFSGLTQKCRGLVKKLGLVSDHPSFLALANFRKKKFGKDFVFQLNQKLTYGPDREERDISSSQVLRVQEFQSPSKALAANMVGFLLESNFSCKRPGMNAFFIKNFGSSRYSSCSQPPQLHWTEVEMGQGWFSVDPKKVAGIYLLYATPGATTFTKYGHVDLILAVCAPHRKEVGPECMKDFEHHVSVGYHANKQGYESELGENGEGTLWSSFVGNYISQMHVFPLERRLESYVEKQGRPVHLYPIKATKEEILGVVYHAFEKFVTYRGAWKNLSNNCVTQLIDLLRGGFIDNSAVLRLSSFMPIDMVESMDHNGLLGESVIFN